MTVNVDSKVVARALGIPEDTPVEQVIATLKNPPVPRMLPELGAVVASAPVTNVAPDLDRRFLPELA
jgi:hypothetical protein